MPHQAQPFGELVDGRGALTPATQGNTREPVEGILSCRVPDVSRLQQRLVRNLGVFVDVLEFPDSVRERVDMQREAAHGRVATRYAGANSTAPDALTILPAEERSRPYPFECVRSLLIFLRLVPHRLVDLR